MESLSFCFTSLKTLSFFSIFFLFSINQKASEATSTTVRPNPAWLITSQPSVWGTSTVRIPTTAHIPLTDLGSLTPGGSIVNKNNNNNNNKNNGRKSSSSNNSSNNNAKDPIASQSKNNTNAVDIAKNKNNFQLESGTSSWINQMQNENASAAAVTKPIYNNNDNNNNSRLPTSSNGSGNGTSSSTISSPQIITNSNTNDYNDNHQNESQYTNGENVMTQSINSLKTASFDESNGLYCGPTTARNLFWNFTRVGDINVQPCPGGATGIAKWRCTGALMPLVSKTPSRYRQSNTDDDRFDNGGNERSYMWWPTTPDLTQCRSLWLNSLEVRVNQRDSALVSVANDLSQVILKHFFYLVIDKKKYSKNFHSKFRLQTVKPCTVVICWSQQKLFNRCVKK